MGTSNLPDKFASLRISNIHMTATGLRAAGGYAYMISGKPKVPHYIYIIWHLASYPSKHHIITIDIKLTITIEIYHT